MDLVQWYTFIVFTISITFAMAEHGERRQPSDFRHYFLGLIGTLPYIGRVFRWW